MSRSNGKSDRRQRRPFPSPIWERIPAWGYIAGASVLILGLMVGLPAWSHARMMNNMAMPAEAVEVGSQASGFTLNDASGKAYTLTPGDGKAHLLVVYMGYF